MHLNGAVPWTHMTAGGIDRVCRWATGAVFHSLTSQPSRPSLLDSVSALSDIKDHYFFLHRLSCPAHMPITCIEAARMSSLHLSPWSAWPGLSGRWTALWQSAASACESLWKGVGVARVKDDLTCPRPMGIDGITCVWGVVSVCDCCTVATCSSILGNIWARASPPRLSPSRVAV